MCKLTFDMSSLIFHSFKITKRGTQECKKLTKEKVCVTSATYPVQYTNNFSVLLQSITLGLVVIVDK